MDNRMTQQESCGQRIMDRDGYPDDIKTVAGLIYWLQVIAQEENVDADCVVDVATAAASRLKSMQDSLRQEVERIEKLQPFFTEVSRAVDEARKPQH